MNPFPRPTAVLVVAAFAVATLLAACTGSQPSSPAPTSAPAEPSATATPSSSPTPSVTASASPSVEASPSLATSPTGDLRPFAVAPNPAADALFLIRDECQNDDAGYRLEFPDDWWTNTAFGDVGACSWFAPTSFEATDPSEVPDEIAIVIEYLEGDRGSVEETISREFGLVGGTQPAVRVEERGAEGEGGIMPSSWREYSYLVQLGPTEEHGPNLVIRTDTDMGGDYELNKAVIDRIVATLELIGTIQ